MWKQGHWRNWRSHRPAGAKARSATADEHRCRDLTPDTGDSSSWRGCRHMSDAINDGIGRRDEAWPFA
jgi:hypothetical protein